MSFFINYLKSATKAHLPAIIIFILAALIFVPHPLSQDFEIQSGDSQSFSDGHRLAGQSLWNPYMFSGMPTTSDYGWLGATSLTSKIINWVLGVIPSRSDLFYIFWACLGFYIFAKSIRMKTHVSTIGALAYGFSTYNVIIIAAGHLGKFIAMAYMPMIVGGVILVMDGVMIGGAFLILAFVFGLFSHQQIGYYTFFTLLFVAIHYLVVNIQQKTFKPLIIRGMIVIFSVLAGVSIIFPSNRMLLDYNKQTVRGAGELNLEETPAQQTNEAVSSKPQKGLDIDYAFMWSSEKMETFTLLFPGIYGYGNKGMKFDKNSDLVHLFQSRFNMPEDQAIQTAGQFAPSAYYGSSPFVEGPVYFGVLVCLLAVIGVAFAFKHNKHMPWLLALTVVSILMSWGSNFMAFNQLLFDYLPMYNSLRVPFMILVITQFTMVAMAVIGLDYLVENAGNFFQKMWDGNTKKLLIISGSLIVVGLLLYMSLDFTDMPSGASATISSVSTEGKMISPDEMSATLFQQEASKKSKDVNLFINVLGMVKGDVTSANMIVKSLIADRKGALLSNVIYALWFILGFLVCLYLLAKKRIKPIVFFIVVGLLVYGDLVFVDKSFLNKDFFRPRMTMATQSATPTKVDQLILQDTTKNYRVLGIYAEMFNDNSVSTFHQSVGGYSPAKLALYNDLIKYQLYKLNPQVLNMLNTKYFIQGNKTDPNARVEFNPNANGSVWFVSDIHKVKNASSEMRALDTFDSKRTAIIQEQYANSLATLQPTQTANDYIKQTYFSCDTLRYAYEATSPQLAVFSEIYSPYWKAFDEKGNELEILKVNYALRGLALPAGKQTIEFRCEPELYFQLSKLGTTLQLVNIGGLVLVLLLGLYGIYKKSLITPKP